MATKKISALSTGTTANAADKIPIERAGANLYVTPLMLYGYTKPLLVQAKTSGDVNYVAGDTRINFDTVSCDPNSTITTGGSWMFTVPVTGYYMFIVDECNSDANGFDWALSDTIKLYLYKSTSTYLAQLGYRTFDVLTDKDDQSDVFTNGASFASLTAAETCHLKYRNQTAQTRKLYAGARLSILRVA